jgi:hypothetical protein
MLIQPIYLLAKRFTVNGRKMEQLYRNVMKLNTSNYPYLVSQSDYRVKVVVKHD